MEQIWSRFASCSPYFLHTLTLLKCLKWWKAASDAELIVQCVLLHLFVSRCPTVQPSIAHNHLCLSLWMILEERRVSPSPQRIHNSATVACQSTIQTHTHKHYSLYFAVSLQGEREEAEGPEDADHCWWKNHERQWAQVCLDTFSIQKAKAMIKWLK